MNEGIPQLIILLHRTEDVAAVRHQHKPGIWLDYFLDLRKADPAIDRESNRLFLFQRSKRAEYRIMVEFCSDRVERSPGSFDEPVDDYIECIGGVLREDEVIRRSPKKNAVGASRAAVGCPLTHCL